MTTIIRKVAVLGAGTMGAQIAAHFANAGLPVLLLDLTKQVASDGLKRARAIKPDPFFTAGTASLVETGGFDTDLERIADCDWVVEAIVERLDVKQALLAKVEEHRRDDTVVSTNTSGIPVTAIAEGRSQAFREHWLGTHFFNPPRYLKLLEVIPTTDTRPHVVERISRFADLRLGKGVVVAKDTPNFIANHIGLFAVARTLEELASGRYTIEEIDAMTGPFLGRPRSATFRTLDIAGLDVLAQVSRNLAERLEASAQPLFTLPPLVDRLVEQGWIGEKAGQGFYKRVKGTDGSEIQTLDPNALTYRPRQEPKLPGLDALKAVEPLDARLRAALADKGRVGSFLRATLGQTLLYAARVAPSIAHSIDDVDRAMLWGMGWERGPFETIDLIGARELLQIMDEPDAPPLIAEAIASGRNRVRSDGFVATPGLTLLADARERERVVKKNAGASLVDIGDGVLAVEFHSKMNAIGGDTLAMLKAGVAEAERNFAGLVVGNDSANFSAGANLMLLLLEAQEGNWDEIDLIVRVFQRATTGLRYAKVPVVVAVAGLTLGGGCEVLLHGDRVQAAAESYIGLVEVGVGLIPAGGGTKEMLVRSLAARPSPKLDPLPYVQRVFETIGFAKVSTSAEDARSLGFLRPEDRITMNRDRLLADAKDVVLTLARGGYRAPAPPTDIPVGGSNVLAALKLGVHLAWRAGQLSDHDALIGRKLANVLAGGDLPQATPVSEQYLLDLEREAFISLCGERKTQERIQYTLKTGKTLRN
jgi:3-hydroxyacyl-CoA dehydrogenase